MLLRFNRKIKRLFSEWKRVASWCSMFFLLLFSCMEPSVKVQPSFYHWQTNLDLSVTEQQYLKQLGVEKVYAKFFDVDWDFVQKEALPLAQIQINSNRIEQLEIVPTIFITNRTLLNISSAAVDTLASRIYQRILSLSQQIPNTAVREIQIDCDWTQRTKTAYFNLLKQLKTQLPATCQLSATIRLHQVKFPKRTGIPPVDRGMLMFYNMGDLENWESDNSILNVPIGKQYLDGAKAYPLTLDVALPIFSWGVLYRNGRMIKLINNLEEAALKDTSRFQNLETQRYEVIKSTYLDGYYLYKKDLIRLEQVSYPMLKESAVLLKNMLKKNDISLSFYHLDTATIKNFPYEQLESIYQILEH